MMALVTLLRVILQIIIIIAHRYTSSCIHPKVLVFIHKQTIILYCTKTVRKVFFEAQPYTGMFLLFNRILNFNCQVSEEERKMLPEKRSLVILPKCGTKQMTKLGESVSWHCMEDSLVSSFC